MTSANTLKTVRVTHLYLGVFFAPTILFFAITGGLQMFGLHETSRGSDYTPPALLVHLSQLHKKGTLYVPRKRDSSAAAKPDGQNSDTRKPESARPPAPNPAPPAHNSLPMKIFFGATAVALIVSTCTGLYMSWKYARRKATVAGVLLAGIICPLLLLLF
jgi:hypothetical protein